MRRARQGGGAAYDRGPWRKWCGAALAALIFLASVVVAVACGGDDKDGASWRPQRLRPFESDVAFTDAQHGWAVGLGGLAATGDGGASWTKLGGKRLTAVCALDEKLAWAVGVDGAIVAADGADAVGRPSGTGHDLWGVAFASADVGWAVGSRGTILHTRDGGTTWNAQSAPTAGSLSAIACTDGEHAWAAGSDGIIATSDGGAHWRRQLADVPCEDIVFVDADRGWAVGRAVYATTNGGADWREQTVPEGHTGGDAPDRIDLTSVSFADAEHGWAVGDLYWYGEGSPLEAMPTMELFMISTADGGEHWLTVGIEPPPKPAWASGLPESSALNDLRSLNGVSCPDPQHGWAVGSAWGEGVLFSWREL